MTRSGSARKPSARTSETRQTLVDAAVDVLRHEGFAAATARTIADRAGCNQGLVFYHYGSVVDLLLAALDQVSCERRYRYERLVAEVHDPVALVDVAARVFEEDLDTGDARLLVEMIAGATSTPGLGVEVKARVTPWTEFASAAMSSAFGGPSLAGLVDLDEVAHVVVALYLGLELVAQLDGDRSASRAVFDHARQLARRVRFVTGPPTTDALGG